MNSATYNGISEPEISDSAFEGCNITSLNVPTNYEGDTFCGKRVDKTITPDNPDKPKKPGKKGNSKATPHNIQKRMLK